MHPEVKAVFAEMDDDLRERLFEIRALIFEVAEDCEVGPLIEALRWGEPSYLTETTQAGTTVRLGRHKKYPDHAALFVNCQTTLVDEYRSLFADELEFEGNRAVLVPLAGELPSLQLGSCIRLALTYHRRKRKRT